MTEIMPILTLQQLRVVLQLAAGQSYKRAAANLGISVHTVKLHVDRVAQKLGGGVPKVTVLCYADRLIAAQTIEMVQRAKAA